MTSKEILIQVLLILSVPVEPQGPKWSESSSCETQALLRNPVTSREAIMQHEERTNTPLRWRSRSTLDCTVSLFNRSVSDDVIGIHVPRALN